MRQGGIEGCDLLVGGPAVGRESAAPRRYARSVARPARSRTARHRQTTGYVARQRLQQCRQERGGQMRAVGLQRVEHGGRDAPRVVGGQPPGRTRRRAGTGWAAPRHSRRAPGFADRAAALLAAVSPRPAGAVGSTDGILSRLSSRSTSSTRSAGCTRSAASWAGDDEDRRIDAVLVDPRADLGQPVDRRTRLILDTGHPVGQVGGIRTAAGDQSLRGGSPRQSVNRGSTVPPAMSASRAAQRSMAQPPRSPDRPTARIAGPPR